MVNEIENVVVKQVKDGILSRYVFKIPIMILEKLAEQNIDGKIALYEEEMQEIECFLREMSMTDNELYEKKITEHCNMYDIILCQRIFRFVYYMQKEVYLKHLKRNSRVCLLLIFVLALFFVHIGNIERIMFWAFIAGNVLYYMIGVILAFVCKDNRVFCNISARSQSF